MRTIGPVSRLQAATWVLGLAPLLSPTLLYLFVLRARVELGRWPSFSNPDPKELGFDVHHSTWHLALPLELAAAPVLLAVVLATWSRRPNRRREMLAAIAVYFALLLSSMVLFWADPGGFSEWMMD